MSWLGRSLPGSLLVQIEATRANFAMSPKPPVGVIATCPGLALDRASPRSREWSMLRHTSMYSAIEREVVPKAMLVAAVEQKWNIA
jgi:hypothetical protein